MVPTVPLKNWFGEVRHENSIERVRHENSIERVRFCVAATCKPSHEVPYI